MIQARGSYDALTPVAKGKWTKLLLQNRARCEGMRALMLALVEQAGRRLTPAVSRHVFRL